MRRLSFVIYLFAAFLLPGVSQAATFAQLALGGGYEATLFVTNRNSSSWQGQITIQQSSGLATTAWYVLCSVNGGSYQQMSTYNFTWRPFETRKFHFRLNSATTDTGFLKVIGAGAVSEANVAFAYFYQFSSNGTLTSSTGSPPSATGTTLSFPVERSRSTGTDSGYAWAPDMVIGVPFPVDLTLYDANGFVYATKTVTFNGHFAQFVSQTFPQIPSDFVGHMVIESQYPIAVEVLRMDSSGDNFLLTSTPPLNATN